MVEVYVIYICIASTVIKCRKQRQLEAKIQEHALSYLMGLVYLRQLKDSFNYCKQSEKIIMLLYEFYFLITICIIKTILFMIIY
jgi:hypothetical protein